MNHAWLAPTDVENEKQCHFRAVMVLNDEKPSTIDVAVESHYILYVNGQLIGRGPARGTRRRNYMDSHRITHFIQPGRNVIALIVHCMNIPTYVASPSQPAFHLELDGRPTTNEEWRVQVASDWEKNVPIYTKQTGYAEWRDMRRESLDWLLGIGVESWAKAITIPSHHAIHAKALSPRDIPPLRETPLFPIDVPVKAAVPAVEGELPRDIAKTLSDERHLPLPATRVDPLGDHSEMTLRPSDDGAGIAMVFDFGDEVIGRFELEIDGRDGAVVDIGHGEALRNHRVQTKINDYNFADRYILRDGPQIIGNSLNERGFRLAQVVLRNFTDPLTIRSVQAVKAVYPYVHRGAFHCDDFSLNQIQRACAETLSTCTTDIFTDCPWRERAFWVNDLIVENKTSLECFGASAIHRRAFRMAFSETRGNGLIPGVCPCPDEHERLLCFPATNMFMPLMLRDYLMRSGDKELITELLPQTLNIFEAFEDWFDADGLILPPEDIWNFVDWGFETTGASLNGKNTAILNYLYVMAIDATEDLAAATDRVLTLDKHQTRAENLPDVIDQRFFKNDEKRLADWLEPDGSPSKHSSQLTHAIALLSGKTPRNRVADFQAALDDDALLKPELYLSYFLFQAMARHGKAPEALRRIQRYWGSIMTTASPTIWEFGVHKKGDEAIDGAGSLCHGFATAPIDFFQTVILGVEPVRPGFEEFSVDPRPCGLSFAQGRVPTPHGNIHVKWRADGDEIVVDLNVPTGTRAIRGNDLLNPGRHSFRQSPKEGNSHSRAADLSAPFRARRAQLALDK